jgi:hypothetical protein
VNLPFFAGSRCEQRGMERCSLLLAKLTCARHAQTLFFFFLFAGKE